MAQGIALDDGAPRVGAAPGLPARYSIDDLGQSATSSRIIEYFLPIDHLYVMPRVSPAVLSLPSPALAALRKLGGDLTVARKRRRQSLKDWSARMQVSIPTLMKMEKGDPAVSIGVYATALWMINRHGVLANAADPQADFGALEADVERAGKRHQRKDGSGV